MEEGSKISTRFTHTWDKREGVEELVCEQRLGRQSQKLLQEPVGEGERVLPRRLGPMRKRVVKQAECCFLALTLGATPAAAIAPARDSRFGLERKSPKMLPE